MSRKTKRQQQVSKISRKKGRFVSQKLTEEVFEREEIIGDEAGIILTFFIHDAEYHFII